MNELIEHHKVALSVGLIVWVAFTLLVGLSLKTALTSSVAAPPTLIVANTIWWTDESWTSRDAASLLVVIGLIVLGLITGYILNRTVIAKLLMHSSLVAGLFGGLFPWEWFVNSDKMPIPRIVWFALVLAAFVAIYRSERKKETSTPPSTS